MFECRGLTYSSANWTASFTFSVEPGQWVGIAGPSGGGKSTMLRLLIGFLRPTRGNLLNEGKSILALSPHARLLNYMSQQNSLLPHLSCQKNLELALHDTHETAIAIVNRITRAAEIACIPPTLLNRYPGELSGGELARMNLARTLLRTCKWLLLDEPFAALDADLRLKILTNLGRWQKDQGAGIMLVSHEPADAMLMADRLFFVESGHVTADGRPEELAFAPRSIAMAKLLKTGSVFQHEGKDVFIAPQNLFTSLDDLKANARPHSIDKISSYSCSHWKAVQIGASQMIIDLDRDQYWLLPLHRAFLGTVFFRDAELIEL